MMEKFVETYKSEKEMFHTRAGILYETLGTWLFQPGGVEATSSILSTDATYTTRDQL
jgi:hypothetical protein